MTTLKPKINLRRLVIISSGKLVYDEVFHDGVNVIRGDNGTGKTTIMDFIFYALGGDISEWTAAARSCDVVYCTVMLNDDLYTFIRNVEITGKSGMGLYAGDYEKAIRSSDKWQMYPYSRSEQKKSFSQVIFDILGLPYQKVDENTNLTLHQLLRLIYLDQITPPGMTFRQEPQWDNESTRQAIGEYLTGLDDMGGLKARQKKMELNKEFDQLSGELSAAYKYLGEIGLPLNKYSADTEIADIENQIKTKTITIQGLKNDREKSISIENGVVLRRIRVNIGENNNRIRELNENKSGLLSEMLDSVYFIETINNRLISLEESRMSQQEIGVISFDYCPSCLAKLEPETEGHCVLCKGEMPHENKEVPYLNIRQELDFQIKESETLLKKRQNEIDDSEVQIKLLNDENRRLRSEYDLLSDSTNATEEEIGALLIEIGFLEKSLDTIQEKATIIGGLDSLSQKKADINEKLSKLNEIIERQKVERQLRRDKVKVRLEELVLEIIKTDEFEDVFKNGDEFEYDFGKNRIHLNGMSKFSASSMVYLKNAFRLAIIIMSMEDEKYRMPRFALFDNIEDKGMQPERSQQFQNILVEMIGEYQNKCQIIYTTSMVSDEIDKSELCIGPYYKKGTHTLEF